MDIENLKKAYEALEMLQALNLPVSDEQTKGVANLEKQYLQEDLIPQIKENIAALVGNIRSDFVLKVTYTPNNCLKFTLDEKNHGENPKIGESVTPSYDRTRYSFDGGLPLNKRRFVLTVVKEYVNRHPGVTLEELEKRFPSSLSNSPAYGVVRKYDDVVERLATFPDLQKRFFLEPDDIIRLQDGTKVVVYNQWGKLFEQFLTVARELHVVEVHEKEE